MSKLTQTLPVYTEATTPVLAAKRLSGIDALRAVAMLLGVFFHATIAYKENALPNWPYDNSFHHWSFDFLYLFIHSFRMPLFFLIAGYFCRLLYYKIGAKAFIQHRIRRILIPFVVSLIIILPLTIFPFLVYTYSTTNPSQWQKVFQLAAGQLLHWNGMAHLWFLYYLLIYYTVAIGLLQLAKRGLGLRFFRNFFSPGHYTVAVSGIVAVWLALLVSPGLYLHVDTGIIPGPAYLLFYGIFFGMGWAMNKMISPFAVFVKNLEWFLLAGVVLSILIFLAEFNGYLEGIERWKLSVVKFFVAQQIVFMVYGVIGFFLRFYNSAGHKWRYISDSSYWMYLIHLGVIAGLQVLCMYLNIPGFLRFPLVLSITVAVALITYHYWVRYSILGEYLHGARKKKSGISRSEPTA